jgi:hypothetical protein
MKENEFNPEAAADKVKPEAGVTASKGDATPAKPKPDAKTESKAEAEAGKPSDLAPQLVRRVNELCARLGREEVRAVLA